MNRRILSLTLAGFLGALIVPTTTTVAQSKPHAPRATAAEQIATKVQQFYDRTRTFKARFKQRYYIPQYKKTIDSTGHVVFQKPGKMSWRYTNNGNRVVSDGITIKVFEKDNKQMFVQKMNKSQYPAALSFLVGGGNLRKEFRLRTLDPKKVGFEGGFVLEGRPRQPTPAYQIMLLYVDAATHQVRRVLLLDAQGNRNRFDFIGPSVNTDVSPNEFKFHPPEGTKTIRP